MSGYDIFAWIVLIILVASAIGVFCIAGWLPGHIAKSRNHPRWWTPMACRSISPSRPVKRMTIGCVRFCSARYSHKQCCSRIADTTRTGSGSLPDSKELGRTFRRKRNRKDPICFSPYLYRARNLVERFFNKIKQCRRVATRYDKLAANYLAFIKLASIRIWLRANESTP